jgi:hypothetical protein
VNADDTTVTVPGWWVSTSEGFESEPGIPAQIKGTCPTCNSVYAVVMLKQRTAKTHEFARKFLTGDLYERHVRDAHTISGTPTLEDM